MAEDRVLKYLLDTNVISVLWRKAKMAPGVRQWVAGIAATAKVHGLVLVTRNTRDFRKSNVSVLNPFGD